MVRLRCNFSFVVLIWVFALNIPLAQANPKILQALGNGQPQLVDTLIQAGEPINETDEEGNTALLEAARLGYHITVRQLLQAGAKVDHRNDRGYTPLILAARECHAEIVTELLEADVQVDAATPMGRTALMHAVKHCHSRVAQALLRAGADPNYTTNSEKTPLYQSLVEGNLRLARLLIGSGADVNLPSRGRPPLFYALKSEHNSSVLTEELIRSGANVNARDEDGVPLLQRVIISGFDQALRQLLDAGADPNVSDEPGKTLLDSLIDSDNRVSEYSAYLLVQAGAKLSPELSTERLKKMDRPLPTWMARYYQVSQCATHEECLGLKTELQAKDKMKMTSQEREAHQWLRGILKSRLEETYLQESAHAAALEMKRSVTCAVCMDEESLPHTTINGKGPADCSCYLCATCTAAWIKNELSENGGKIIQCPECRGLATQRFFKSAAENPDQLKQLIRHQGQAAALRWAADSIHCPTPDCIGRKRKRPDASDPLYFSCAFCDFNGCVECKKDHHGPCAEAEKEREATAAKIAQLLEKGKLALPEEGQIDDPADPRYLDGRWRPCYYCGIMTERNGGCNSIVCQNPSCKRGWHWNYGDHRKHPHIGISDAVHDFQNLERKYEPLTAPHL